MKKRNAIYALLLCCGLALTVAACGSSSSNGSSSGTKTVAVSKINGRMLGPAGEEATDATKVKLTPAEEKELSEGSYTAAFAWHEDSELTRSVAAGAKHRFDELGIKVVGETTAEFDPAKQQQNVATLLARNPSAIISIPVDATSARQVFAPALKQGVKLVFLSNIPEGYEHGKDYVGVVSADQISTGENMAKILGEALGGKGKIGIIDYEAEFFITNQRDAAFEQALKKNYPGIEVEATSGFSDPEKVQEVAEAMIARYPDLEGIYTTWAQPPGEAVLAALQQAGRENDVKIVTSDLSEPIALSMAEEGAVAGVSVDRDYEIGEKLAEEAGLGVLGKSAPAFAVVETEAVTAKNLLQGWEESSGSPAPAPVQEAVKEG
jgi:ribose transport system substrate-binding protein